VRMVYIFYLYLWLEKMEDEGPCSLEVFFCTVVNQDEHSSILLHFLIHDLYSSRAKCHIPLTNRSKRSPF
jgi:hypothetical protein